LVTGLAVLFLYMSAAPPRGRFGVWKKILAVVCMGAFGGVGAAGLLDTQGATAAGVVELPLVRVEQIPGRGGRRAHIVTVEPENPTRENMIPLHRLSGAQAEALRPGMCLLAQLERGRFGSLWISQLELGGCSPIRGWPSSHVIVPNDVSSWRWHSPARAADGKAKHVTDNALPPELVCRTRANAWLYRCGLRRGETCWPRPRAWPHPDPAFISNGIGGLIFYEIGVRADGSLTFNGDNVDIEGLQRLLAVTKQLQPIPPLVLRTTDASECATAERVRLMLDRQPMCRDGSCFESARWKELGFPSFEEQENRSARMEGRGR
jgi:hypothetical protein